MLLVAFSVAGLSIHDSRRTQHDLEFSAQRVQAGQIFADSVRIEREGDVISAMRWAARAAEAVPEGDVSLDDYLSRVVHLAAAGPVGVAFVEPADGQGFVDVSPVSCLQPNDSMSPLSASRPARRNKNPSNLEQSQW